METLIFMAIGAVVVIAVIAIWRPRAPGSLMNGIAAQQAAIDAPAREPQPVAPEAANPPADSANTEA